MGLSCFEQIMNTNNHISITECPRDAMQGITEFIPTDIKLKYLQLLLNVGFDILDFASFVSEKAIPQLKDSKEIVENLDLSQSKTKLLSIIANEKGAEIAANYPQITYVGYPFSISETFQIRNTKSTISESFDKVKKIKEISSNANQNLLIYISMAFGNPYNDKWDIDIVLEWLNKIKSIGVSDFAIADTIGISNPDLIHDLFLSINKEFPNLYIAAHLHSTPETSIPKIDAALHAGVKAFDSALKGFGGCPMAEDKLTGNLATEILIEQISKFNFSSKINLDEFNKALIESSKVFSHL